MAYDGWLEYNGVELVNVARTVALAQTLGIDTVKIRPASVEWLWGAPVYSGFGLGGFGLGKFGLGELISQDFSKIAQAPWYDPGYAASAEFAGFIPLSVQGLDDSTTVREVVEYIGDGGHAKSARNSTLPVVANFALVASTERGAEFGKRWLDRLLRNSGPQVFCGGADLRYYRWGASDSPIVHRRDVVLTRATSVTRKTKRRCSVTWVVGFTLTANDSYEYGEMVPKITSMGGPATTGPGVMASGSLVLPQMTCPVYDYSPIYDPLYPALVEPPTAPDFYPAGWTIEPGDLFMRRWARITPVEPTGLNLVPILVVSATTEARMVRVSIWDSGSPLDDQCGPLFSTVISYLPANMSMYIDGEQRASYTWDGSSPVVRRTDSLVFGPEAKPVQWSAFNDYQNLLVTLDVFEEEGGGYQGADTVRVSLDLVPKSD